MFAHGHLLALAVAAQTPEPAAPLETEAAEAAAPATIAPEVATAEPATAPAPATPTANHATPASGPAKPPADTEAPDPLPRLTLAVGPLVGPHASGEAACMSNGEVSACEHTGNFFGLGANLELRVRAAGPMYFHGRGAVVGNVRRRPYGVHRGLGVLGVGVGVYGPLAFIRVEYMFVPTFGPSTYRPPFYAQEAGRDVWTRSAGMISAGVRKYVSRRVALELWGGLVVGPRSQRTSLSEEAAEDRVIVSFLSSAGISFDPIPGRNRPLTK